MTDGPRLSSQMLDDVRRESAVDYVLHFNSLPSTNDRAKSDCTEHPPIGLGLYITKMIVTQFGGEVWVESVLGEGSSFFLTFELNKTSNNQMSKFTR